MRSILVFPLTETLCWTFRVFRSEVSVSPPCDITKRRSSELRVLQRPHPSGSPVWLEGDFVVSRHLTEIPLQLPEELLVAFRLLQRHKGVNVGKLLPGDWLREQRRFFFFFLLLRFRRVRTVEVDTSSQTVVHDSP